MSAAADLAPYDAILLGSFGGPESAEEVVPYLRRVTAGRNIPDERLVEVGEHYYARGGRSPINDLNRDLIVRLGAELERRGLEVPVLWGNRNSEPFFADALHEALGHGATRVVALFTSAYSCYSSCRQYREDLAAALEQVGPAGDGLVVDKVRQYVHHPGLGRAWARALTAALRELPEPGAARVLYVTHSIPVAMDDTSGPGDGEGNLYTDQHLRLARRLDEVVGAELGATVRGELVFCSRSGPPSQPWLEPDVNDRIEQLAAESSAPVVLAPIGFVSDHMEVVHDLDTEAAETARRVGVPFVRVPTPHGDDEFAPGLVDLLLERAAEARGEVVVPATWLPGDVRPSVCDPGCCPNLRVAKPALCGRDG
ncbi:ferrochelatase [Phycicoccus endophyticus]|uniref:Coproporphyrin III ferrochelatase n=1 Tax=Phycicoccus endophyticus TaxID=1690220 RepID=A0A7G9R4V7_9MICO|nr:ferrochelatase [Phycicoccus endophyticus]NHI18556.1 ferrochelatase [Phycicoccus endophyticus]QNN50632.1 ferrochelatase [Phycicoccus endophyticus]GGL22803.1 putative ferrochelatase [Phycicoccus endophyticus]